MKGTNRSRPGTTPWRSSGAWRRPSRASWTHWALSRDVKNKQEIAQVGTIAANHDQVIGDLIAEAMEQVGKDGVITVEEGHTAETTVEGRGDAARIVAISRRTSSPMPSAWKPC